MRPVTADTNIYVSGLISTKGQPHQFLALAASGAFPLAISDPIQAELTRILRDKFGWPQEALEEEMAILSEFAIRVTPGAPLNVVKDDPDDNKIVECAVAAGSEYIVTGDKHLLSMGQYEGIQMIRVADFLGVLQGRGRSR